MPARPCEKTTQGILPARRAGAAPSTTAAGELRHRGAILVAAASRSAMPTAMQYSAAFNTADAFGRHMLTA